MEISRNSHLQQTKLHGGWLFAARSPVSFRVRKRKTIINKFMKQSHPEESSRKLSIKSLLNPIKSQIICYERIRASSSTHAPQLIFWQILMMTGTIKKYYGSCFFIYLHTHHEFQMTTASHHLFSQRRETIFLED